MGDRITSYEDCPKCSAKGQLECCEQLSSLLKIDECMSCGFVQRYDVNDENDVITVTKIEESEKNK